MTPRVQEAKRTMYKLYKVESAHGMHVQCIVSELYLARDWKCTCKYTPLIWMCAVWPCEYVSVNTKGLKDWHCSYMLVELNNNCELQWVFITMKLMLPSLHNHKPRMYNYKFLQWMEIKRPPQAKNLRSQILVNYVDMGRNFPSGFRVLRIIIWWN